MPRVVFTHAVSDVDHWVSKHSERVQAFSAWGSNVLDHVNADGSKSVGVSVDVHDMDAMQAAMQTPEMGAAKEAHG
ncbi:MAG: hypothetical protein KJN92_03680, partial [Gemmatimonadetes bacterium]|nr:hypothetical protein [Gemmatimonadota bacterium]